MIALTPQSRVLLARDPVDFRRGIDGLARICKGHLASDPFSGAAFAFRNRANTAAKASGSATSGFPRGASSTGRREASPHSACWPRNSRCCFQGETRGSLRWRRPG